VSAIDVVQRQLDAYNAHDLAGFAAAFSDSVQVYRMPATQPAILGKAQLAEFYAKHRFNVPGLRAELVERMVVGNKVVDHEFIHGLGNSVTEGVAVYQVVDELITSVWFFSPD
jgi:hypothetical protein